MTRLLRSLTAQAKEQWTVPMYPGDQAGNFSEGAVAPSFVQHALVQHPRLVRSAVPVAHQNRSRRRRFRRLEFQRLSASRVVAQAHQESASGWFESSASLLLDSICHRSGQQFAADAMRWLGTV